MSDVETIATVIAEAVNIATASLRERIKELETRSGGVSYGGIFSSEKTYPTGTLATRSGGIWLSTCETTGVVPGSGQTIWKLVCKEGRSQ